MGSVMFSLDRAVKDIEDVLRKAGVEPVLEEPPEGLGDYAFPCFSLSKKIRKAPDAIAQEIAGKCEGGGLIERVEAKGPYVNFFVKWGPLFKELFPEIKEGYCGRLARGKALIEHTSINPNASPHVGRARNAIIGDSLARLLKFAGYGTQVRYFVNDVGKQIAVLVYGYEKEKTGGLKFEDLLGIYVKASREVEERPEVEKEIFLLLQRFEAGDTSTVQKFREVVGICVRGQEAILRELGAHYDSFDYESEFLGKGVVGRVMKDLEKTGKLFTDEEGRKVLDLSDFMKESPYLVVARSDGTSLYPIRDIAYTIEKIKNTKGLNLVVLGEDQKLYFRQISEALRLLGHEPPKVVHYSFVLLPSGKMSTRKGEVVLLKDFIEEAYGEAMKEVESRYKDIGRQENERRARAIAVAAVRYAIVKVSPEKNVMFNLSEAVRLEGDTGPYLQYTYARARSILEKGRPGSFDPSFLKDEKEKALIKELARFPKVVGSSIVDLKPHYIANYAYGLCERFNSFYQSLRVLQAPGGEREARLALVESLARVLGECLSILGIEALEEM